MRLFRHLPPTKPVTVPPAEWMQVCDSNYATSVVVQVSISSQLEPLTRRLFEGIARGNGVQASERHRRPAYPVAHLGLAYNMHTASTV